MPQMLEARQDFAAVSVGDAVYLIGGCPQPLTFHSSLACHVCKLVALRRMTFHTAMKKLRVIAPLCFSLLSLSILLVPVWVMDELPVQLLCFLSVEVLTALWALEAACHLDPNILNAAISGHCCGTDLHGLWHLGKAKRVRSTLEGSGRAPLNKAIL